MKRIRRLGPGRLVASIEEEVLLAQALDGNVTIEWSLVDPAATTRSRANYFDCPVYYFGDCFSWNSGGPHGCSLAVVPGLVRPAVHLGYAQRGQRFSGDLSAVCDHTTGIGNTPSGFQRRSRRYDARRRPHPVGNSPGRELPPVYSHRVKIAIGRPTEPRACV